MNTNDALGSSQLEPDWSAVAIGTPVYTVDGKQLGTVEQKQSDGLLVRGTGSGAENYLASGADIGRIEQDGVHLIVSEQQAMRAHWQGTSPNDETAPGGMAPGAMARLDTTSQG